MKKTFLTGISLLLVAAALCCWNPCAANAATTKTQTGTARPVSIPKKTTAKSTKTQASTSKSTTQAATKSTHQAQPKAAAVSTSGYQNVVTWGKKHGMRAAWTQKNKTLRLSNDSTTIVLNIGARHASINNIKIALCQNVKMSGGNVLVSTQDINTALEAITNPRKNAVRIVAIDPGHGGSQPGAKHSGKAEKDITLLIAKEVRTLLQNKGVKVVMTRTTDRTMDLKTRPQIAAQNHADIFVSIHLNAASADANGAEVFTTTPAGAQSTTPDSGSTAATRGNKNDAANALLAYHIQRQLVQKVQFSDRGVKRKRLGVLYDTAMPAVLVEAGFISGSKDQKKLFNAAERSKIAKAIAEGILSYKKTVESVKPTPAKSNTAGKP